MAIPRDFVDQLLSRTDITDIVSGYLSLKKSGSNSVGLCPFHTEKTPSFSVNSDLQIFKCFGCGVGGNALTFVMKMENLPYREAVEVLCKHAGMALPEQDDNSEFFKRRKRILELNREAAFFYHNMLKAPGCGAAREYLASRKISKEITTRFGLGAISDDWSLLYDAMTAKGFTTQELIEAGLARRGQKGGMYDFFRDRIMFPVIDVRGDVVAFSGRAINDDTKGPKYLNSPDSMVFNKGKNLFGLNIARRTKAASIILVEGNFDVVMLHQAGFDNVVAQLGSAFTSAHARLLAQYTDEIVLAFDGDEAGKKATLKALPLLEDTGKKVRVVNLESGDPDEYIKKHGADAFRVLVDSGENRAEYTLQTILSKYDTGTDSGRLGFLSESVQYLAQINNDPEREIYSRNVAKTAGVSYESVKSEVERTKKKKRNYEKQAHEKSVMRMKESVQPAARGLRYTNEASAVAEEGVIRCLLRDRTLAAIVRENGLNADDFTSELLGRVFAIIEDRLAQDRDLTTALVVSELTPDEAAHIIKITDKPESASYGEKAVMEYIAKIKTEKIKNSAPTEESLLELARLKKRG